MRYRVLTVICLVVLIFSPLLGLQNDGAAASVGGLADSPWPIFGHDAQHTGRSQYTGPDLPIEKWKYTAGGSVYNPVVAADGTIYVGSYNNKLYAVNPDGSQRWTFAVSNSSTTSPAIASDRTIYFSSSNPSSTFYAVNPDGTKKWSFATGIGITYGSFSNCAIATDGIIYVGFNDGSFGAKDYILYAFNPDGSQKWSLNMPGGIGSPAIAANGTIYIGSDDYKLYAINPDGNIKWSFTTGGLITSSPAIAANGTIYIGSYDKKLYAINPDGLQKWSFTTNNVISSSPALAIDGTIYVGSSDENLYAINPDGSGKWILDIEDDIPFSPTIAADGVIYLVTSRSLHSVNPDGTQKWNFYMESNVWCQSSPVIAADGSIYIGTENAGLLAIGEAPPRADFSVSTNGGKAPLTIQFLDRSKGKISSWEWDFDNNGTVDSVEQNPSYTYTALGKYTVSLSVNGSMGSDTKTKVGYIHVITPYVALDVIEDNGLYYSGWELQYDQLLTSGHTLIDIWGSSPYDIFAVGAYGPVMHYDGTSWSPMELRGYFSGIWGSSSFDVFAVGYNANIFHYDGSSWSLMSESINTPLTVTETLYDVWGSSSADVFATGTDGVILHYDGSKWSKMNSGTGNGLLGVWGSSSSDVFAVGEQGIIVHYNGNNWSSMSSGTSKQLHKVWGSSPSDIYAVGEDDTILHYDGSNWSPVYTPVPDPYGSNHIDDLYGVWGTSSSNIFAVGEQGRILHYDGNIWKEMKRQVTRKDSVSIRPLHGIWGSSSTDIFIVGGSTVILHYPSPNIAKIKEVPTSVSSLRELTFLQKFDGNFISQEEYRKMVLDDFKITEEDRDNIKVSQELLVMMDLMEEEQDLYSMLVNLYTEAVAGFYDIETKELYVIGDISEFGPVEERTYAHEYTHALQDQNFDLGSLGLGNGDNSDLSMAIRSLIEGDAELLEERYHQDVFDNAQRETYDQRVPQNNDDPSGAVPLDFIFPYTTGKDFVKALWEKGGWDYVDNAYKNPPQSTEQIIHPEKYLDGDSPQLVNLPDLANTLGGTWKQMDTNILGELEIMIYLSAFIDMDLAETAAEGWDGDRYAYLKNEDGKKLLVISSVWDSASDASEFFNTYEDFIKAKSGDAWDLLKNTEGLRWWQTEGSSVYLSKTGVEVLIVLAPDKATAEQVSSAFADFSTKSEVEKESGGVQDGDEGKGSGFLDCSCGDSGKEGTSTTTLLTGWSMVGVIWGGGYYLVRRKGRRRE